jgi:ethanolamine utilization protein EutA (predicted chaperonin)
MGGGVLMTTKELPVNVLEQEEYKDEYAGEISADELWAEINQKALEYFNLSGAEFAEQYRHGALPDSFAVSELGFLLRCINDSFIPA